MIDVSVLAGASPRLVPASAYGFEAAVDALAAHGVSSAVIGARAGAAYRVRVANDLSVSRAGTHSGVRVYPVATLNPVEHLDWPAELERALAAGAVALRLFPEVQNWPVTSEAFRAIVQGVRGRCPLLVPVSRFGDASAIGAATCDANAPVVLLGGHYTQLGDCLAALKRWPHLYLETSCLGQFRGVETVVREVSASRLLFGSGAPARPIQAALNAVMTADISDVERRAILSGNAARVFGLPAEPFELPSVMAAAHMVDVHAHIGAFALPTPAIENHATTVARHGITLSLASSLRAIADELTAGNDEAFGAASDAVRPYVVVNPNDLEGSCQALDQAYARDIAVGAKLHCGWSHAPTATRQCMDLVREVLRRGRPLLIHVVGPDWSDALLDLALEFPMSKLIVAHAGPGTPVLESACLVERTRNVYVELATSFADRWTVQEVVRRVGPERLLFGSDAPLLDPAYVQGIYADADADLSGTVAVAHEVFRL